MNLINDKFYIGVKIAGAMHEFNNNNNKSKMFAQSIVCAFNDVCGEDLTLEDRENFIKIIKEGIKK